MEYTNTQGYSNTNYKQWPSLPSQHFEYLLQQQSYQQCQLAQEGCIFPMCTSLVSHLLFWVFILAFIARNTEPIFLPIYYLLSVLQPERKGIPTLSIQYRTQIRTVFILFLLINPRSVFILSLAMEDSLFETISI